MEGRSSSVSVGSSRLYSGPLSASARRILAALRAQSRPSVGNYNGRTSGRCDGAQRRDQRLASRGSWYRAQEEEEDEGHGVIDRPWSRPQSYSSSSPVWPCEPATSGDSVSLASTSRTQRSEVQREGRHAAMAAGDGPRHDPRPGPGGAVTRGPPPVSDPREAASAWGADEGEAPGSSGGVLHKRRLGSPPPPRRGQLTRREAGGDGQGPGPMGRLGGEHGAGHGVEADGRIGGENGRGAERGPRAEAGTPPQSLPFGEEDSWPEEDEAVPLADAGGGSSDGIGGDQGSRVTAAEPERGPTPTATEDGTHAAAAQTDRRATPGEEEEEEEGGSGRGPGERERDPAPRGRRALFSGADEERGASEEGEAEGSLGAWPTEEEGGRGDTEVSPVGPPSPPRSQERGRPFRAPPPLPRGTHRRRDNPQDGASGSGGGAPPRTDLSPTSSPSPSPARPAPRRPLPPLAPPSALKRKRDAPGRQSPSPSPRLRLPLPKRPARWEPPRSSQPESTAGVKVQTAERPGRKIETQTAFEPRASASTPNDTEGPEGVQTAAPDRPKQPPHRQEERGSGPTRNRSGTGSVSEAPGPDPGQAGPDTGPEPQSNVCLTHDPRVKDAGKLSAEERGRVLEEAGRARALVLTMVCQDGTTQLDPEQKSIPAVCGVLVLVKTSLELSGPEDSLVYLRLEHTPAWAQQHHNHNQDLFTREMLLQVFSGAPLVVCYKAKDFLRTALQHYRHQLTWKQVWACRIQDPQVAAWLLDPADSASCFRDLLDKHCRGRAPLQPPTPAVGTRKVSQIISSLNLLYSLNAELCSKLQAQGLWQLYSNMELSMIPVLAAMENQRIRVDRGALKRTSELLGTKMKQLEQEAHQAAGQMFLVSSSTQLRTVLFEKLRLHERCENKKLPKTVLKQQQSTSEAALLQLQDLHPLPKIILEYRQIHKVKSTFVDGILSCMKGKDFISSTWCQTSAVTGRISAKNPNFQALPRQPVQITKKQYVQGKEAELVAVHPRAMFIPHDGWTFLSADFCQVELRLLAHLSSDPELLRIFSHDDAFTMLASQWKGVSEGEVSSEDRERVKRIVYSVVYGAGRERLSGILGVSAGEARLFQDGFLQRYRDVQAFIHRTIQLCHKQGYVVSMMGRRRSLPLVRSPDWTVRTQAERQAVNFVLQGSAADLCKMAMIRISSQISSCSLSARLVAQLHDELLYEVEDSQVDNFAALVKTNMESLQHIECLGVHLTVPLKVAVSSGKSWGSMSELNPLPAPPLPSL